MMTYEDQRLYGEKRIFKLMIHLQSCFTTASINLFDDHYIFTRQMNSLFEHYHDDNRNEFWIDFLNFFELDDIIEAISELDLKKDSGPMKIPVNFIIDNRVVLGPILLNIFNSILVTGMVPSSWKTSFLNPIPKKGQLMRVENYRGIAMQSCIPKIFDKLITKKLYHHVNAQIPKFQHGFFKKRSTTSNLLEMSQFLHDNIRGNNIDAVYFDYSKAFDQVDHVTLARKLISTGIPFEFFNTIMNFITNRKYIMKADSISYEQYQFVTHSGVPLWATSLSNHVHRSIGNSKRRCTYPSICGRHQNVFYSEPR